MFFTSIAGTIHSALREAEGREGFKDLLAQRMTKFKSGQDPQP
jgi:hypothetical protein